VLEVLKLSNALELGGASPYPRAKAMTTRGTPDHPRRSDEVLPVSTAERPSPRRSVLEGFAPVEGILRPFGIRKLGEDPPDRPAARTLSGLVTIKSSRRQRLTFTPFRASSRTDAAETMGVVVCPYSIVPSLSPGAVEVGSARRRSSPAVVAATGS
jgi:hypothetical protein